LVKGSLCFKESIMDFFDGDGAVKKGKAVSHEKIPFFPVGLIIKPGIMFRPRIFKIRQKAFGTD